MIERIYSHEKEIMFNASSRLVQERHSEGLRIQQHEHRRYDRPPHKATHLVNLDVRCGSIVFAAQSGAATGHTFNRCRTLA